MCIKQVTSCVFFLLIPRQDVDEVICDLGGKLDGDKRDTQTSRPSIRSTPEKRTRETELRPNKVRTSEMNPTAVTSAQYSNLKSIPGPHPVDTCVDVRGSDQCEEDKGNPFRFTRAGRGERPAGPVIMMYF